ncbi:hypothetical protein J7E25_00840 [Agromyces sp. ISL-38]|uniref:DUF6463 family protein n=1 Tax=Agromyces sp. ISL-38 TaxID=2819107 RepID=UPI001BEA8D87|nr:DUF6463 family protein [Agromyces sp. ISL-38]MBT2497638.1 hypothetical protein [Agromyces sp. ISL-38]MBT2517271.1 hypothetical protein [Streptomyces sp. ISL-90]
MTATEAGQAERMVKSVGLTAAGGWVAIVGGVIHLVLTSVARADVWRDVVSAGWWNTVTLRPDADELRVAEAFWLNLGSFAVPLLTLGILVVFATRRGHRVPGVLGWILAAWGVVCASLLPVSGAWLFIVVGVLFVAGDRVRALRPA